VHRVSYGISVDVYRIIKGDISKGQFVDPLTYGLCQRIKKSVEGIKGLSSIMHLAKLSFLLENNSKCCGSIRT